MLNNYKKFKIIQKLNKLQNSPQLQREKNKNLIMGNNIMKFLSKISNNQILKKLLF